MTWVFNLTGFGFLTWVLYLTWVWDFDLGFQFDLGFGFDLDIQFNLGFAFDFTWTFNLTGFGILAWVLAMYVDYRCTGRGGALSGSPFMFCLFCSVIFISLVEGQIHTEYIEGQVFYSI